MKAQVKNFVCEHRETHDPIICAFLTKIGPKRLISMTAYPNSGDNFNPTTTISVWYWTNETTKVGNLPLCT